MREIAGVIVAALSDELRSAEGLAARAQPRADGRATRSTHSCLPQRFEQGRGPAQAPMRIWVDMTRAGARARAAPDHRAAARGRATRSRSPRATTRRRRSCSTLHGMEHTPIGRHGGASRLRKLVRLLQRTRAMRRLRQRARASTSRSRTAPTTWRSPRACSAIPEVNMLDYEFAVAQHHIGCRLARRVIFPDSIPPERLRRFGVGPEKLFQYPGLQGGVLPRRLRARPRRARAGSGVDTERVVVVVRPPPDVSLYHRKSNPLFPQVLAPARDATSGVHAVVLPRTEAQRELRQERSRCPR